MIPFSGVLGRGQPPSKHQNVRVKVQSDIRTSTHYTTNILVLYLAPLYSVSLANNDM